jgi:TonB family protein
VALYAGRLPGAAAASIRQYRSRFLFAGEAFSLAFGSGGIPPAGRGFAACLLESEYPVGAGIGMRAREEGGILVAVRRQAFVRLSFDVDERGYPIRFRIQRASAEMWGGEAIALLREWRFTPGEKNGVPISVPCTLDLVWGERNLTRSALARLFSGTESQPPRPDAGGDMPKVIYKLDPSYSNAARDAKLEGTVVVSLVVGEDGTPKDARVVKPLGLGLDEKAIEAVRGWRFSTTLLNGRPAAVAVNVEVNFRLQ